MEWPYPIRFRQVRHETVDVLVIGGGIVGAAAGLKASKRGVKVAVVDKAPIKHSGCGGAGLDHYNHIFDNPVQSPITPEEYMARAVTKSGKQGHGEYIHLKGAWEFLLELEELGLKLPQICQLSWELRKAGLNLPEDIITAEELKEALLKLKNADKGGFVLSV